MRESAETVPKPLVEIGGRPILWHVMSLYASQGLSRFVLLLGHGGPEISAFAAGLPADWEVTCVDTGLETPTGGRIARARSQLEDGAFCVTYADGRVAGFREKPRLESWINGGFFVMEPRALDRIGPDDVLEQAPLEGLATDGELYAFRHDRFWACMDTYKDHLLLNELWARGEAPWRGLVKA